MDYLLKSSVCLAAFYGVYFFGFRRLTFHTLNRLYLLASLALSLTIPMISYEHKEVMIVEPSPVFEEVHLAEKSAQSTDNQIVIKNTQPQEAEIFQMDWEQILTTIYLSGMAIMLFIFLRNIVSIIKVLALNEPINDVFYTKSQFSNASFFNYIFLNPENLSPHEQTLIIAHESFHAQLLHTLDLLLLGILKAVFWFNPIIYFYQKSLKQIHEYEVDALMSATHDSRDYAHLLMKLAVAPNSLIINHFSTKPLSDRIKFLFRKPTKNMKKLLYFLMIPMVGIGVMAFAEEQVKVVYKEKFKAHENLKKSTIEAKEILSKNEGIKKEKLILDTLRDEPFSQIDSSRFSYQYGFYNFKLSLEDIDSLKIIANDQLLVEGEDFILKENKIFLDQKYKGSKTKLRLYAKTMGGGSLLYPNLAKLEETPYPKFNKAKNLPIFEANKENLTSIYSSKLLKLPTTFSKISRNQDTLRTILEANKLGKNPLVFINDEEYPSSILYRINPDAVIRSSFMPPNSEKGLEKFGEKAQDGVMKLNTTKGVDFLLKNDKEYAVVAENLRKQMIPSGKRIKRVIIKDIKGNETEQISFQSSISGGISSFSVRFPVGQKTIFFLDGLLVDEEEINNCKIPFIVRLSLDEAIKEKYQKELKEDNVIFNLKTKRE